MPSWLMVALQLALIAALMLTTQSAALQLPLAIPLLIVGTALGLWAISANRWGNFNIRPELKRGARLITGGPYRWIRHPMYSAIALGMAAFLAADFTLARVAMFAALIVVLVLKAAREERYLRDVFPEYLAYSSRTRRFVPLLW